MTKALLVAATLCLGVSSSMACEFQRTAKATQSTVDQTVVASIAAPQSEPAAPTETTDATAPLPIAPVK